MHIWFLLYRNHFPYSYRNSFWKHTNTHDGRFVAVMRKHNKLQIIQHLKCFFSFPFHFFRFKFSRWICWYIVQQLRQIECWRTHTHQKRIRERKKILNQKKEKSKHLVEHHTNDNKLLHILNCTRISIDA